MVPKTSLVSGIAIMIFLLLPVAGCSIDGPVGSLGFVEVSWKIKGLTPSATECSALTADKVRVDYGSGEPDKYSCDHTDTIRRSAGDKAKLAMTIDLLNKAGKVLDSHTRSITVVGGETTKVSVDFFGTPLPDGGPDGSPDGAVDMGLDSMSDTSIPDTSPDSGVDSAPDSTTDSAIDTATGE